MIVILAFRSGHTMIPDVSALTKRVSDTIRKDVQARFSVEPALPPAVTPFPDVNSAENQLI